MSKGEAMEKGRDIRLKREREGAGRALALWGIDALGMRDHCAEAL